MDGVSNKINQWEVEVSNFWENISNWANDMIPIILDAVLTFAIGWLLAIILSKIISKAMKKSKLEKGVATFFSSVIGVTLKIFVVLATLSSLQFDVSSMIAAIGAAGIAAGFAVKDTLANVASGIVIVFTKPFVIGDFIELPDLPENTGNVTKIDTMFTTLVTPDNKTVIIPNSLVATKHIINYTRGGVRRLDVIMPVSYSVDIETVKPLVQEVIQEDDQILRKEMCGVLLDSTGESTLNLCIRVWCKSSEYAVLRYKVREEVYKKLNANGIYVPFNQLDVHLDKAE